MVQGSPGATTYQAGRDIIVQPPASPAPFEDDRSMSLTELRLALGVTEALLNEALWLLTFPGDKRITYPTPGRVALGPD